MQYDGESAKSAMELASQTPTSSAKGYENEWWLVVALRMLRSSGIADFRPIPPENKFPEILYPPGVPDGAYCIESARDTALGAMREPVSSAHLWPERSPIMIRCNGPPKPQHVTRAKHHRKEKKVKTE